MANNQPFRERNLEAKDSTLRQLNQLVNDNLGNRGPRTKLFKFPNILNNSATTAEVYLDGLSWPLAGVTVLAVYPLTGQSGSAISINPLVEPQPDGRWKVTLQGFPSTIDQSWQVNLLAVEDTANG